jgi:hypothetical protein
MVGSIYATLSGMQTVGFRTPACSSVEVSKPQAGFLGGFMRVVLFSFAITVSASAGSLGSNTHQARAGMPVTGAPIFAPQPRMAVGGFYYSGYRPEGIRGNQGPVVYNPRSRQNQGSVVENPANNVGTARTQEAGLQSERANLSAASQSLSAAQGTAQRSINLPAGVKPQVTTTAERSQAARNINQKFQQAEGKMATKPWTSPDRRNRLEQSRAYFISLIDSGYPLTLLDTWCDDLLDDQVELGMPEGLIDSYWGQPVSTQDYEEYYNPYEVCTYQTQDGNYRQVTFQNGVVSQAM